MMAPGIESLPAPVALKRKLPPKIYNLLCEVARQHDLSLTDLLTHSNAAILVNARAEAMQRLKDAGFSLAQIGRWLGLHHSTVIYHLAGLGARTRRADPEITPDHPPQWWRGATICSASTNGGAA
jgi:chromosomal replication initiation ATPase DnaA